MLKCFIFASRETTRAEARNMRFGPDQDPCPVKTSFRDLGAHFDVARTATATTLNKRTEKVRYELRTATKLPMEHQTRVQTVRVKWLPRSLYMCDVA